MRATIQGKSYEYHYLRGRKGAMGYLLTSAGRAYVLQRDPSLDRSKEKLKGAKDGNNGAKTKKLQSSGKS
jgi:hypothetical protein